MVTRNRRLLTLSNSGSMIRLPFIYLGLMALALAAVAIVVHRLRSNPLFCGSYKVQPIDELHAGLRGSIAVRSWASYKPLTCKGALMLRVMSHMTEQCPQHEQQEHELELHEVEF